MTDDLKELHEAPETIYLQVDPDGERECDSIDGATWCSDKINSTDICYVKAYRIKELEAECEELKADAMRYRWLRDHGYKHLITETPSMSMGRGPYICLELPSVNDANTFILSGDVADGQIDAAIAKGEK